MGIALPGGGSAEGMRKAEFPVFDPEDPSRMASMILPGSPQLTNAGPQVLVEAAQKMLRYLDALAMTQWNCYTELILARHRWQTEHGVDASPGGEYAQRLAAMKEQAARASEENIVAKLMSREVAPLQPKPRDHEPPTGKHSKGH